MRRIWRLPLSTEPSRELPRWEDKPSKLEFVPWVGEASFFFAAAFLLIMLPVQGTQHIVLKGLTSFATPKNIVGLGEWTTLGAFLHDLWPYLLNVLQLFVLLMLPRFVKNLLSYLLVSCVWLLLSCSFFFILVEIPAMRELRAETAQNLPVGILVPEFLFHLRTILLPLFPLVLAVAASNGMRSWQRFGVG